jgi:hypothetical protein
MPALRSVINIAKANMQTQCRRMKQSFVEINCAHVRFLRGWGGLVGLYHSSPGYQVQGWLDR